MTCMSQAERSMQMSTQARRLALSELRLRKARSTVKRMSGEMTMNWTKM
jgi:hypothetical protein